MGKYPAVGLPVHRLWAQRGREQEDVVTLELLHARRKLHHFHLDQRVFLGSHPLATCAVVVGADLGVARGVDRVTLAEGNLLLFAKLLKLPANERVVVWVDRCRDERSPPVHLDPHGDEVVLCNGGEVLQPVHRVHEARNDVPRDAHRLERLPLVPLALLGRALGLGRFELGRVGNRVRSSLLGGLGLGGLSLLGGSDSLLVVH
mmetsp:Transcript_20224/g.46604  ORF Transcript_20224/g.46604 Transcript_20224/m.46604 type:complete len:204 (-) Transcript_20224:390-1001(-)